MVTGGELASYPGHVGGEKSGLAYLSAQACSLSAFVISKTHIVAQKQCRRQLNAKGVSIHWTGLLDWTTGLTFLSLKIIFMLCN